MRWGGLAPAGELLWRGSRLPNPQTSAQIAPQCREMLRFGGVWLSALQN